MEYYHYDMFKEACLRLGVDYHDQDLDLLDDEECPYNQIEDACGDEPYTDDGVEVLVEYLRPLIKY